MSGALQHRPDLHDHLAPPGSEVNSYIKVSDVATTDNFPQEHPVYEFTSKTTINEALHGLAEHNYLSAPVWDEESKKYLGFVDVCDLLAVSVSLDSLVHLLPVGMLTSPKKSKANTSPALAEIFESGSSPSSPWCPVEEGTPMKVVLKLLATKARRVPVLSKTTGRVKQIISQSAVVALLHERLKSDVLPDTPMNSGVGIKEVLGVSENDKARDAFEMMVEKNISAVAVFDADGALLSCISTKDIRVLPRIESAGLDGVNPLDLTAREFVSMVRLATEKDGKTHAACVAVPVDSSLSVVLGKMAVTKVHRVFIVHQDHRAVGVISASDIIFILNNAQPRE